MSLRDLIVIILGLIALIFITPSQPQQLSTKTLERIQQLACSSALISENQKCDLSVQKPKLITVGFACMLDYKLRLTELSELLSPPSQSSYRSTIKSEVHLSETIAYLIEKGSAGEFTIDPSVFSSMLSNSQGVEKEVNLGGNGGTMARRLVWENVPVELICPLSEDLLPYLQGTAHLSPILPSTDIHLNVEYKEGEQWGSFRAYRSNRFYMNADQLNIDLRLLDDYTRMSEDSKVAIIGGVQLVQELESSHQFIDKLRTTIDSLHGRNKLVHLELGDIHNNSFYRSIMDVVFKSDSLGMNEQELGKLLAMTKGDKFRGYEAKAKISRIIEDLNELLSIIAANKNQVSRIHLHTISLQTVCSKSMWTNPVLPAARSSLLSHRFACNSTDIQLQRAFVYSGEFYVGGHLFTFGEDKVHSCWDSSDFYCCTVLVPTCSNVVHVTGLGDSISAIGLGYQNIF